MASLHFKPVTACWYSCNYDTVLLSVLENSGDASNLDMKGFRYTKGNEGTDINDIYIIVNKTSHYTGSTRSELLPQFVKLTLSTGYDYDNYILPNADNIKEVVFGFSAHNNGLLEVGDFYDVGYPFIRGYEDGNFMVLIKLNDDTIIGPFECRNYESATVQHSVDGNPIFFSRGGNDIDLAWSMGTNNGGYSVQSPYADKSQSTSFTFSHRVFESIETARNYLQYGIEDGALNEEGEEPEEEFESDLYFYEVYNEYYSDLALTNHILTTNQKYTITFEDYPKGTTPIHAQLINNKYMNNVQFIVKNGYGKYITSASSRIGNIEVPITTDILSTFMAIRTNYGILEDTINDRYCKTVVYTNMPIIGVDGSALPGRIPDSDDMISAENGANYDCGLSECWLLDTENVSKLASIFNTTIDRSSPGASELVLAEWVQGLSCYSNPLDVVCDLFYMPINVSDYITGSSKAFTLQPSING